MGASDKLPVAAPPATDQVGPETKTETGTGTGIVPMLVAAGYVNIDVTAYVHSLPGRDGRVTGAHVTRTLGGMSANLVSAAASLGAPWPVHCELISTVGCDSDSEWVLAELDRRGVGTTWMARPPDGRITYCVIMVEPGGHRAIISEPMEFHDEEVTRCIDSGAGNVGLIPCLLHVEGYRVPSLLSEVERARRLGWRTSIDLDGLPAEWRTIEGLGHLGGLFDVVFMNREIARAVWPAAETGEAWQGEVTKRLRALLGVPVPEEAGHGGSRAVILFTLGEDGLVVVPAGAEPVRIPGTRVKSVDTTGAGDVFAGCFLAIWLNGVPVKQAARFASVAAALSTTGMGAQGRLPESRELLSRVPNPTSIEG